MKRKITYGFVIQNYSDNGSPESQQFVSGDQVEYDDGPAGNTIDGDDLPYLPFDMTQPEDMELSEALATTWPDPVVQTFQDEKRGLFPEHDDPAN